MAKEVKLTREGFEKLKDEIELLSTTRRHEVAERIKSAREFGDISENSEYDDAKNEQAMLEARIALLEERLRDASVIEADELSSDVVSLGAFVAIDGPAGIGKHTYQIVGSPESNPDENRLSSESPIGKALLGHKKGDLVDIVTPKGPIKVKVVSIKAG